jgi:RNA polymerase sigma factor (sigma-70 family)
VTGGGEADDGALVALALVGDARGQSALMARHRAPVYRLVRAHVGDADEALDVTQEAFIAAFGALARYDPARPFRHWIARIALNKCRDWARRRAVRGFFTRARPMEEAAAVADPGLAPDARMLAEEETRALGRALAALPANLKEPLLLCAIEGMSQAEAGAVLGLSAKAVEMRLYRARARLAELLRDAR